MATRKKPTRKKKTLAPIEPAQTQQPATVTTLLERAATDPTVSVEKLERLVDLQVRMMQEQMRIDQEHARIAHAAAMSKFQKLKKLIKQNRQGVAPGQSRFHYADYPAMVDAISPWLEECDLSFTHRLEPVIVDGNIVSAMVFCVVRHAAGHAHEESYPAVIDARLKDKLSPSQLFQMPVTYAKRQSLALALGLATAEDVRDDDAMSVEDAETITESQAADLRALLNEVDRDEAKLLQYLKTNWKIHIQRLDDIPAKRYDAVVSLVEGRRRT